MAKFLRKFSSFMTVGPGRYRQLTCVSTSCKWRSTSQSPVGGATHDDKNAIASFLNHLSQYHQSWVKINPWKNKHKQTQNRKNKKRFWNDNQDMIDLTACQPTWVMLCRNELCQKLWKKYVNNIIQFVEATVNMMKFKVCKGDRGQFSIPWLVNQASSSFHGRTNGPRTSGQRPRLIKLGYPFNVHASLPLCGAIWISIVKNLDAP